MRHFKNCVGHGICFHIQLKGMTSFSSHCCVSECVKNISLSFLVYVLLTYLCCVCFGLVDFATFFCIFARHIIIGCCFFFHIACIHPITMHSLTDTYLFAWLCSCHIHCIWGYWIMDCACDSFIEYQGFIHTHQQITLKKLRKRGERGTRKLEQRRRGR